MRIVSVRIMNSLHVYVSRCSGFQSTIVAWEQIRISVPVLLDEIPVALMTGINRVTTLDAPYNEFLPSFLSASEG
jgi:hypothetical protein